MTRLISVLLMIFFVLPGKNCVQAQAEVSLEARVEKILLEEIIRPETGGEQLHQKLQLEITTGGQNGKKIVIDNGTLPLASQQKFGIGDRVVVHYLKNGAGGETYLIADYVRRDVLGWLGMLFLVVVLGVARWRGLASLIGMGVSFGVIFFLMLPRIMAGWDPILVSLGTASLIVPITFCLSHGINRKTTVAIIGTGITLAITGFLSYIFIGLAKLTGFSSEEAGILAAYRPDLANMRGILLAGMIISSLGILDDVTVSQAAIVAQLSRTVHGIRRLFAQAMEIGHDHIASTVNTLILVYAGASLPFLLVFSGTPRPFGELVNYEFIAEEVVRTLVTSIGLVLAVPITTFLAAFVFRARAES